MTTRYGKYIIRKPNYEKPLYSAEVMGETKTGLTDSRTYIDETLIPGCNTHIIHLGVQAMPDPNPIVQDHDHPYDEIILALGTDMDHPEDLNGEIEWILGPEQERHRVTTTSSIFLPKGLQHNLRIISVRKPILIIAISLSGQYQ